MNMMNENPSVIVKRKNIQPVLDYCLENKIEFKAAPRDMPEEWDIEFSVNDIMKAINLGMFLKENKLDLAGFNSISSSPKPATVAASKPRTRKTEKEEKTTPPTENKPAAVSPIFSSESEEIKTNYSSPIGNEEALF
ncbi:MAG: hypothetical protein N2167_04360 [Flavobacteriales bacterium]|nr:hypothetical protein [Flavobacteriales bacterium]